jgi:hypothetical protein
MVNPSHYKEIIITTMTNLPSIMCYVSWTSSSSSSLFSLYPVTGIAKDVEIVNIYTQVYKTQLLDNRQ